MDSKGLTELQGQINQIEARLKGLASKNLNDTFGFEKSAQELEKLNKALSSSFNSSLGMLDLSKLRFELDKSGVSAKALSQAFKDGGAQGQIAFNNLLGQIGKIDTGIKRSSSTIDKMFNTIANTARWGVVSSAFSAVLNSLHEGVKYVKELDDSMTQIMLVTDYSRQQMNEYAKSANEAAKALGNTTVGVMQGTQVFAQQGFNLQQSGQLAELSIKLANASEQDSATTSDQITALMNAYGLSKDVDKLKGALDSWAKVANVSAADVEELAKASQKAASTAATVDVSLEQLNAQIATIESVTKEAPEQIGNGLKTLYARFSDLQMGETLEDGVTLGSVTSVLNDIGVEVLDARGQMRSVGDMIEDMMEVWSDLNSTQKASVAQTVAGKYQLGRFEALMNSPEMYDEYAKASKNAEGTLDQMNEKYLDSLEGKTAKLQATLEGLFNSVFNPENFYPAIDALTKFIELINKFVESVGGGKVVLTGLVGLFGHLFSNNMAQLINDRAANARINKIREENAQNVPAILDQLGYLGNNLSTDQKQMVEYVQYIQKNQGSMSEKAQQNANEILNNAINSLNKYEALQDRIKKSAEEINILLGADGSVGGRAYKDANGKWEFLEALEEIQNFDDVSVAKLKKDIEENVGKASKVLQDYILKIQETGKAWAESKSEEVAFQQFNELENAIDGARQQLERLKSAISPDAYDELCAMIDKAEQEYRELGTEIADSDERMKKSILILRDLQEAQRLAENDLGTAGKQGGQRAAARILNLSGELAGAEAAKDNNVKMTKGVIDSQENQKNIRSIIEVASAVQQLIFSWQSFQSLGSLWAKDDVSTGEKLLQTLMNLSMVLPNLITGFEAFGLKNPLDAFKDLSSAKEAVSKADQKLNEANENLNQSQEEQTNIANKLTQAHEEEAEAIKETESSEKKLAKVREELGTIEDLEPNSDDSEYDKRRKKRERKSQNSGNKGKDSDAMAAKAKKLRLQQQEKELTDKIAESEKKRSKAVDEINNLEREQTGVIGRVKTAQEGLTLSEKAQTVATETLTKAKAALKAMLGSLAVSAVIGGLTAIWGYMEEQQRKAEEAEQKALEKSNEISQSLKDNMKNYLSLRDEYEKTGVASDEFKDALLDQSEQLGILGADLDIARGRYEALTEEIDKNTIATLKNNASKNANTEKEKSDSLKEKIATGLSNSAFQNAGLGTLQTSEQYLYGGTGASMVTTKTFDENLTVLDMIEKLQDRQAKIEKTPEDEMPQELKDELDSIKKILSDESIPELQEANTNKVSSAVQSDILENPEVFKTGSYNDVYKILAEDARLAKENIDELILSNDKLIESEEAVYQAQLNVDQAKFSEDYTDKNFAEQTVQKFNELVANLSPEEKINAWDFLDWEHADNSEIEENLKKLEEGGLTKIKLKLDIEDAQNAIKDVLEAFQSDAAVGYDQLADVFSEDIVNAFKDASGASNVFSDALTLLSNNSFKTQNDMLTLKSALDELDHSVKLDNLLEQTEELPESFENVTDKVVNLADEIEDHSFELTIDIAGDLIDQADGIIEALGDVQDMSQKIGEGFIVAAEDASALEKAFPGILKNYTITADGMIQLDKAIAQGAIDAATADLGATTEAQAEKLNSYATFADAMAESYMAQAEIFAELAAKEGTTKEEVDQQKAKSETKLSQTIESSLIERDKAQKIVAENESKYSKTAGENTASSIGQGAEYGANALAALSQKSAESANNIITHWQAVGEAIAAGSAGQPVPSAGLTGIESSGLGLGKPSISINSVESGDTIEINGKDYTVNSGDANEDAAKQAQEYQAKALGMRNIASQARARAASLEASGLKTKNDISDIGAPKEDSGKDGGGGGSTPKEKQGDEPKEDKFTPKQKEKIKEQVDLYEKINTQLGRTEKLLSRIQQEADRLTGPMARANQNKQIKYLQKEIGLYRQKLDIQLKERSQLKKSLAKNYGVEFNKDGYITNYAEILKQKEKDVNDLIKEYNRATSDEEQDDLEKRIKKAQDDLDTFKTKYTRYDTLHGTEIPETNNQMEELKNNIEDIRVTAYKTAMEAQESLKELGDRAAHFSAVISDNKLGSPLGNLVENTEKLNNLFSNGKKSATQFYDTLIKKEQERLKKAETKDEKKAITAQIKFYDQQKKNIAKSDDLYAGGAIQAATERVNRALYFMENPNIQNNPFRGNTAALEEELTAATQSLEEIIEEAKKLVEDREKYIIDRIKELDEKQQYFIDELKTINEHMEKTMDIFNLAFGEEHYEDMIGVYEQMGATAKASFDEAKNNYNYWKQIWDKMKAKERMEDVGKAAREQIDKWKGAMLDAEKEMLEYWGESFTAKTKKAVQDAAKSIFGRSNLGDIESNWERDQNFANRYYDNYQKQSRIEALRLKYMDLLDNAQNASLDTQRKIRDSMNEQVKYLEDQTYLSEYNVKYANAQLEILQKQIALEDARNNKNQMRLRRDSQGNYRYVYSQNKDDVRNKEQDLLQSQIDLYDMSKQNKADVTESAFNLWRTTMEQLQELAERARQGDQEAIAARNELLADYTKQMEAFRDEWGASTDGMIASVEWMANSGIESVEEVANKALIALTTNNQAALQSMGIEGDALLDKVLENAETAEGAVVGAVGAMDQAVSEYKNHLTTSGGLVSDITEGYGNIKLSIDEASKATQELVNATKTFKEVIRPEDGVLQNYISQLETLRKSTYDLTNEKSAAVQAARKAQEAEQQAKTAATYWKTIVDVKNGDKAIEKGATYTLKKGTWVYYGRGGGQKDDEGSNGFSLPNDMLVRITTTQHADYRDPDILAKYPVAFYAHGDSLTSWGARKKDDDGPDGKTPDHKQHEMWHLDEESFRNAIKMDTGGYTGEWANGSNKNNGRFAMLHQKEMVLNENDTANILEAVQMVRTMTDALKILGNMGTYKGTGYNKLGGDTIKQRVEITAEFPNVSDSNEIEKALLGLADSAYQYSYRER